MEFIVGRVVRNRKPSGHGAFLNAAPTVVRANAC
jgi:hypothetical protein